MTIKEKLEQLKRDAEIEAQRAWFFIKDNKEIIIIATPVVCTAVTTLAKTGMRYYGIREETRHRDLEVYDHSTGSYIRLKRRMTGLEHIEFERLKKTGMGTASALDELGLLKHGR